MIESKVTVINKFGLHTRPASTLVKIAAKFKSEFFIINDGFKVNGKSAIGVMTLAAAQGTELDLEFEGLDEKEMEETIVSYFQRGFDEL